ncbi:MAG: M23 family metallopeptidase [Candidatus Krumholzibacteriota bacterium]|nr:M23 family metallopeptidase [Candidatus Krumholzibacteriota bacterium]
MKGIMDRYFTFLYVRRGNAGVKSIKIRRTLAISGTALLLVLFTASLAMTIRYSDIKADSKTIEALRSENEDLVSKLSRFESEVDELKKRMNINFELQNRARLMANLDPISEDVWQVGVGGPDPGLMNVEIKVTDEIFSRFEKDISRIVRQSRLQKESYKEIIDILEKEADLRDCTPTIRPLNGGFLSSRFGRRMDPFSGRIAFHKGVDYFARSGTPVMSSANGMITMAKKNGSMGLTVEVNHGNGFMTKYAHLSKILVKRGQRIKRGEIIGLVGNSGRSTGPHLHYEVTFRKTHRDPLQYIIPEGVYFD